MKCLLVLPFAPLLSIATAYTILTDETLKNIPEPGDDFDIKSGRILAPILIPRVPGTSNSTKVLNHFADFFHSTLPEWKLEFHNSTSTTPTSNGQQVPFVNLIATRDPPWAREGHVGRLALVAHYDSLQTPVGFIGAIDSAAPCAMILHAVRSIDEALTKKWAAMEAEGVGSEGYLGIEEEKGIQVLLLDGEEAFLHWSDEDSLYGARALAEHWENTVHPAMSTFHNPLSSIELFVLLDLLGSKNPTIPSYFHTTHWAYKAMSKIETRLRSLQQFKSSPNHPTNVANAEAKSGKPRKKPRAEPVFLTEAQKDETRFMSHAVSDDHLPFMARGVEVLHMIPIPFPSVWHELTDDGEHLDMDTVDDWAKLVTAFTAEWMDLEGFMPTAPESENTLNIAVHDDTENGGHHPIKRKREHVISKTEL
ncbi:hypothetical protein M501DRAFT_1020914 [Patellaria atrata CBS 101060]|uniref:Peptide hydrolase n=1 Tax=Patellaria atrata CBS 101060 TaxID=1346257 RepID=A0A9P4VLN4_9PEZI|nr:hypothetical protein M501DRAFT_1020914 [Patellaria atrata CBS 101060]